MLDADPLEGDDSRRAVEGDDALLLAHRDMLSVEKREDDVDAVRGTLSWEGRERFGEAVFHQADQ